MCVTIIGNNGKTIQLLICYHESNIILQATGYQGFDKISVQLHHATNFLVPPCILVIKHYYAPVPIVIFVYILFSSVSTSSTATIPINNTGPF